MPEPDVPVLKWGMRACLAEHSCQRVGQVHPGEGTGATCWEVMLGSSLPTGLALAQRQVAVQEGPLYRTEGSHITLWCKVSGYQGPSEQNFQWSIYLPSAPEREVQIVSTVDPSFPYAIYTQRVRSRGIYVERVQGDAVLLHITDLQDRDAGEYECHTPNTDERYFGSYSAKVNLPGGS